MKVIYLIKNIKTNKVYIGSTTKLNARKQRHFKNLKDNTHHSNKLQNSYNKHGETNFIFEVIEICGDVSNSILLHKEQYWIDFYDSYYNGYNCRPKSENNYGHKHSEITKKLMSKKLSGKGNPMYGKKLSEETKESIRKKIVGRKDSPETIEKKRLIGLNRKHSEETKLKQSRIKNSKPILQLNFHGDIIKEWHSKREPLRELNIRVDYVLKTKKKIKKNCYWIYKSDYATFISNLFK